MHDKGAHTLCLPVDCIACLTLTLAVHSVYASVKRQPAKGVQNTFYAATLQGQTSERVAKALPGNVII